MARSPFQVGQWVQLSASLQWRGRAPRTNTLRIKEVHRKGWGTHDYYYLILEDPHGPDLYAPPREWEVAEDEVLAIVPEPKMTLAEKERLAYRQDPWRRYRDKNLGGKS